MVTPLMSAPLTWQQRLGFDGFLWVKHGKITRVSLGERASQALSCVMHGNDNFINDNQPVSATAKARLRSALRPTLYPAS